MEENLLRFRKDVTYCLCDAETYNLNLSFTYNRIWQLAALFVENETITKSVDVRINWPDAPHLSIGKEAAVITRFDPIEHKRLAVGPQEAFERFWPLLEAADYIIMHNGLRFDLHLLKDYAIMMGRPWKWMMPKILDTKAIAQGIKMGIPYKSEDGPFLEYQYRMANIIVKGIKTNLTALGKEYGIVVDYDNLHSATNDIFLNLLIWNKMKYQIEI